MKIHLVGAEMLRADGRWTDRHGEANERFLQFYERSKKKKELFKNISTVDFKIKCGKSFALTYLFISWYQL